MIDCVLATDMSMHVKETKAVKERLSQPDFDCQNNADDKLMVLKYMFHLADISNPAKDFSVYRDWTDLLFVEFFAQGDLERL